VIFEVYKRELKKVKTNVKSAVLRVTRIK